ncbi:ATP-dependent RNA helicase DHX8 [Hondaea fermentalgiana]|uniref:ATP-dependent RNA helicase DHX8 n=1 Tax=Hondaea fermentalgiana TaxID=2315210 RepID=A0A2R5GM36_9STRA|nr:ATP-dependent RNA helicase DHX8 [Hondaea fermentalgiana]|eukprot:GBG31956.1 ATP-dependent RNA helicase DHX8 [Hondaea fermentalgiana]
MELPDDQDVSEGLVLLAPGGKDKERKHKKSKKDKKDKKDRRKHKHRRGKHEANDSSDDALDQRGGKKRARNDARSTEYKGTRLRPEDLVNVLSSFAAVVGLGARDHACKLFLRAVMRDPAQQGRTVACTWPEPLQARNAAFDLQCAAYVEPFERRKLDKYGNSRVTAFNACMLIQETFRDPLLQRFSLVVIDDFQQRDVHADILLSLLVKIQARRPELRILVFACTEASAEVAASYLRQTLASRSGLLDVRPPRLDRTFQQRLMYLQTATLDYLRECVDLVVTMVVDSMLAERKVVDCDTGVEDYGVVAVMREEAEQRAQCSQDFVFRLCTEQAASDLVMEEGSHTGAEVTRANLSTLCLQLKRLHVRDLVRFPYVTAPPARAMTRALDELHALEAIDDDGELSTIGARMVRFLPLNPALSRLLVLSLEFGCSEEALTIAAMLETLEHASLFMRGTSALSLKATDAVRALGAREGDLVMYVNIYNNFVMAANRTTWCEAMGIKLHTLKRMLLESAPHVFRASKPVSSRDGQGSSSTSSSSSVNRMQRPAWMVMP